MNRRSDGNSSGWSYKFDVADLRTLAGRKVNVKLFGAFRDKWKPRHVRDATMAERVSGDIQRGAASAEFSVSEPSERLNLLTPRERDLFLLLLEGYTLKESARQLSVKYPTANTHMTGIYRKLNVNSRAELIIRYRDTVKKNG